MSILPLAEPDAAAIVRAAERRLHESPYFFLKSIRCHVERGMLTLRGQVPFGQLRQFAEAIAGRVEGVRGVVNQIEVYDPALAGLQRAKGA